MIFIFVIMIFSLIYSEIIIIIIKLFSLEKKYKKHILIKEQNDSQNSNGM